MSDRKIDLSVIIAAYNEEAIIEKNIKRIIDELLSRPSINWEIICVNDGSSDHTGEIIDRLSRKNEHFRVIHHRRNFGQGRALRTAFNSSLGDIFITLDADLSYGPEYIYQLMDSLAEKKADIVLASPYMKGGKVVNVPFHRHFLSRYGNLYLGKMSGNQIATSTCVVRAYRKEVIDQLALNSDGMDMLIEILNKANLMGFRICEIPARLEWALPESTPSVKKAPKRVSKMKITQTIRQYLMLGWLARPALLFILLSLFLILPGLYMALFITVRILFVINARIQTDGLLWAISNGMNQVFTEFTYSVVISVSLLAIGILVFAFSLLILQNQYYYEELMRLMMNSDHSHKHQD